MRFYLLYNKKGEIIETANAGYGFEFDEKEIQFNHPNEKILELSEKDYEKTKNDLIVWKIQNGKIVEKSKAEIEKIKKQREEWLENNTIKGLKKIIEKLNQKVEQLENKLK